MDFSPRCKPHAILAKYYEVVLLISTFVVKPGREGQRNIKNLGGRKSLSRKSVICPIDCIRIDKYAQNWWGPFVPIRSDVPSRYNVWLLGVTSM